MTSKLKATRTVSSSGGALLYVTWVKGIVCSVLTLASLFASTTAMGSENNDNGNQSVADNQLDVSLNMLGHGEMRYGGFDLSESNDPDMNRAYFLMSRSRLNIDYRRSGIEVKISPQHKGIWGQKGQGSVNVYEAWVKLSANNGLFAQIGRLALSYDDERIIGTNDWAMASLSHDVLRLGYEGHNHKAHVILTFNQNAENTYGGTYYKDGSQPYKTMMTAWYHYDIPNIPVGASLLFMNIGMQGGEPNGIGDNKSETRYQQLLGGYVSYKPGPVTAEASYYRQMGRAEDNAKIDAWMASGKVQWQMNRQFHAVAGYDYLSGDDYIALRSKNTFGVPLHDVYKGFTSIYGSHHKFYGLMDFFYVKTYLDKFSPGLQNLYAGVGYSPIKGLKLKLAYHYMATTTKLADMDKTLGHDIDIEASYQIMKDARLSLGYSYMTGTETMQRLKLADESNNLRWGWFSLIVSPKIFTTKW